LLFALEPQNRDRPLRADAFGSAEDVPIEHEVADQRDAVPGHFFDPIDQTR
jgi:hypothetical protein